MSKEWEVVLADNHAALLRYKAFTALGTQDLVIRTLKMPTRAGAANWLCQQAEVWRMSTSKSEQPQFLWPPSALAAPDARHNLSASGDAAKPDPERIALAERCVDDPEATSVALRAILADPAHWNLQERIWAASAFGPLATAELCAQTVVGSGTPCERLFALYILSELDPDQVRFPTQQRAQGPNMCDVRNSALQTLEWIRESWKNAEPPNAAHHLPFTSAFDTATLDACRAAIMAPMLDLATAIASPYQSATIPGRPGDASYSEMVTQDLDCLARSLPDASSAAPR